MNHKFLLFGSSGQIGWELHRSASALGKVVLANKTLVDPRNALELSNLFNRVRPTHVLNAVAYTDVDLAETERNEAYTLNVDFPSRLAILTKKHNALLIDYSTDYVFNGKKPSPYNESDETDPVNHYGFTKLCGFNAIRESGCRHLIFRVSWVYSSRRRNFLKTILRLAADQDSLRVIDDQIGTPTPAKWIADLTCQTILQVHNRSDLEGVYNLAPMGETTWYQFANHIVSAARECCPGLKLEPASIRPIPTSDYPTRATRPLNSRLSKTKIKDAFGFAISDWHVFIPKIVRETVIK